MNVQPDVEFIKYLKGVGGDTLKKCYQCATCSVVCPLSGDQKPFPRKEMIWSQWGMKDALLTDTDVFLCHQCGDCTEKCPRGAKPAEVLGAIRAYAYNFYAWPRGLANLASNAKGLPLLIGIPSVIILVLWFISGGLMDNWNANFEAGYGYQRMFGHWDFHWYAKNIFFIVLFSVPAAGLAIFSAYMGIRNLWKGMASKHDLNPDYKPSTVQFVQQFLWPSIKEILNHNRFDECTVNTDRKKGHKPLVFAFIGLFVVTLWSLFANDILGLFWPQFHGPMTFWNPVKLLGNVSAIALIYGMYILWTSRSEKEKNAGIQGNFYDWFLIWEIMAVGVTGLLAEVFRWAGLATFGHIIYFLHLVTVMMLFLYMPYTKFAHIVYRTFAMAFEKYRESAFAKTAIG
ncbi:quinone-interacting membrane-bound oxidoreductase complex subunit QmoC [Desulfopila inferna]|uniref:quinone-interacting membrane-bound oxidoreductase complex subunit QmoC n=1 Tax=Desulfopila inferna TaxID=468528 RepID=UPI001963C31D|nr:quinone-interacting membrane-bound oxidoreductase complex subunit QmoC [Desulfopila inferna]MBM9605451.1 quinone-interacting membrane-bound oxidoreductase complex subunit QmoC [Desulfopila inferna]